MARLFRPPPFAFYMFDDDSVEPLYLPIDSLEAERLHKRGAVLLDRATRRALVHVDDWLRTHQPARVPDAIADELKTPSNQSRIALEHSRAMTKRQAKARARARSGGVVGAAARAVEQGFKDGLARLEAAAHSAPTGQSGGF